MAHRFWSAVGISTLVVPGIIPVVQATTAIMMKESGLDWLNPGNGVGILLSYVAGGFAITGIASGARRIQRFDLREWLWWLGADCH